MATNKRSYDHEHANIATNNRTYDHEHANIVLNEQSNIRSRKCEHSNEQSNIRSRTCEHSNEQANIRSRACEHSNEQSWSYVRMFVIVCSHVRYLWSMCIDYFRCQQRWQKMKVSAVVVDFVFFSILTGNAHAPKRSGHTNEHANICSHVCCYARLSITGRTYDHEHANIRSWTCEHMFAYSLLCLHVRMFALQMNLACARTCSRQKQYTVVYPHRQFSRHTYL